MSKLEGDSCTGVGSKALIGGIWWRVPEVADGAKGMFTVLPAKKLLLCGSRRCGIMLACTSMIITKI